jgi:hypothetical protein
MIRFCKRRVRRVGFRLLESLAIGGIIADLAMLAPVLLRRFAGRPQPFPALRGSNRPLVALALET